MRKTRDAAKSFRDDAEIAREVRRRLKADFEVPDDRIRVEVTDGLVTVEGIVSRNAQKDATERCVRDVQGVREVANKVLVEPEGSFAGTK